MESKTVYSICFNRKVNKQKTEIWSIIFKFFSNYLKKISYV